MDAGNVIDGEAVCVDAAIADPLFVHILTNVGIEVVFAWLADLNRHLVGKGVVASADAVWQGGEVFLKAINVFEGLHFFFVEVMAYTQAKIVGWYPVRHLGADTSASSMFQYHWSPSRDK